MVKWLIVKLGWGSREGFSAAPPARVRNKNQTVASQRARHQSPNPVTLCYRGRCSKALRQHRSTPSCPLPLRGAVESHLVGHGGGVCVSCHTCIPTTAVWSEGQDWHGSHFRGGAAARVPIMSLLSVKCGTRNYIKTHGNTHFTRSSVTYTYRAESR